MYRLCCFEAWFGPRGAVLFGGLLAVCTMMVPMAGGYASELDERVAALEHSTVRHATPGMNVTLSGNASRALLFWDDGQVSNLYSVNNMNTDGVQLRVEGETARLPLGWKAGFTIEMDLLAAGSDEVNQADDDGTLGFSVGDTSLWLAHDRLGKLTLGLTRMVSGGAPEVDLSGTDVVAYSSVNDVAGGFFLRLADGALTGIAWNNMVDNHNGDAFDIIRYDTPQLAGFTLSASWGEDDKWDVGLSYEGKLAGIVETGAALAYLHDRDNTDGVLGHDLDTETVSGSLSMLHIPSGLNVTFAAGQRRFNHSFIANDGTQRRNHDARFWYGKLGWLRKGQKANTAFYAEYGAYRDFLGQDTAAALVNALDVDGSDAAVCAAAGQGCLVAGSDARIWGLGVVLDLHGADTQLFAGYRQYQADADLVDLNGARVASQNVKAFQTVMGGMKIEF